MTRRAVTTDHLDRLMPMHLAIGADARVSSAGPTLRKLIGGRDPLGLPIDDILLLRRPARLDTMAALRDCAGSPLRLELVGPDPVRLVGVAVPAGNGTMLMNASFGIGLPDGIRDWGLTVDDFAPTDLAAELLYLVEANAAALSEAGRLAERLDAAREAARRDAATDALTGLANRRALESAVRGLQASGSAFALLAVDLDRFKAVNDGWGHEAGDAVLRAVADRIRRVGRRDDLAVRLGGDEFALLLRGNVSQARLHRIGRKIIGAIERPIPLPSALVKGEAAGGATVARVSASMGIGRSGAGSAETLSGLLRAADVSLYRAKRHGGGRVHS